MYAFLAVFFFQAKDGIRGGTVTGVQTCALPISPDDGRVEYALVIRDDEGGSRGGHVLRPRDAETEPPPHQGHRRHLQDRVQHRACSTASRMICTTVEGGTPVESTMIAPGGLRSGAISRSVSWRSRRA